MGAAAYVQHSHEGSTLEAVRCKFPGWPNPSVLRPRSDVLAAQRVVGVKRVVGATQLIFRAACSGADIELRLMCRSDRSKLVVFRSGRARQRPTRRYIGGLRCPATVSL
eukprot:scaffold131566_cov28-Tisochrysis_lutea.AAC.2